MIMFKKKNKYKVESENLAVPEIHTDEEKEKGTAVPEEHEIEYDNLAVPEIHFTKPHDEK